MFNSELVVVVNVIIILPSFLYSYIASKMYEMYFNWLKASEASKLQPYRYVAGSMPH